MGFQDESVNRAKELSDNKDNKDNLDHQSKSVSYASNFAQIEL